MKGTEKRFDPDFSWNRFDKNFRIDTLRNIGVPEELIDTLYRLDFYEIQNNYPEIGEWMEQSQSYFNEPKMENTNRDPNIIDIEDPDFHAPLDQIIGNSYYGEGYNETESRFDWEYEYFDLIAVYFEDSDSVIELQALKTRIELIISLIKQDQADFDTFQLLGQYGSDIIGKTDVDSTSIRFSNKALEKLDNMLHKIEKRFAEREEEIRQEIAKLESDTGLSSTFESIQEIEGELFVDTGYGLKQVQDLVGSTAYLYDGGVVQLTEEEMQELESEHFDPFPLPSEDEMEIHHGEDEDFIAGLSEHPYSSIEGVSPDTLKNFDDFMKRGDSLTDEEVNSMTVSQYRKWLKKINKGIKKASYGDSWS